MELLTVENKKILFVIDSLTSGGAQRQLTLLAGQMTKQGHEVSIFLYHPQLNHFEDSEHLKGVKIYKYWKSYRFDPKIPFYLARIIRKQNFDGAIAFLHTPSVYLEIAAISLKITRSKCPTIIFSERWAYLENQNLSTSFKALQQLHRTADCIVANSHHQKAAMQQEFPWMTPKLKTIYNGVDTRSFSIKKEYKSRDDIVLLCVARVVDYKNYAGLADALIEYARKWGDPPKIIWIGKLDESPENLRLFNATISKLEQLNLQESLSFEGEVKNVQEYYARVDGLIHPSFIEGFSNAIIESMASGLPLLLGDVCDHSWLISNCENGLLFDPYRPSEIASTIRKFIDSRVETKIKWGENSAESAVRLFDLEFAANEFSELI